MKKRLLAATIGFFLSVVLMSGCGDNQAKMERQRQMEVRQQLQQVVAAIKIQVRNGTSLQGVNELINKLETFHEINQLWMKDGEKDYTALDASLKTVAYLKSVRYHLDPARNQNDYALMLMLRPDLSERISREMNQPIYELSSNLAFSPDIYTPAAVDLVVRFCDTILQKPS